MDEQARFADVHRRKINEHRRVDFLHLSANLILSHPTRVGNAISIKLDFGDQQHDQLREPRSGLVRLPA